MAALMDEEQVFINKQDGVIKLDGERIVLTSTAVFGTLRKDLTENLGVERMKGFLIRYGWNLGAADAKKALQKSTSSIEDVLRQGAHLHMMKGYTHAKTTTLDLKQTEAGNIKSVSVSGIWSHSYEVEESIRLFGKANEPVCHTLTGYASGYYSIVCGHTVVFKEVTCRGAGDDECRYIGKSMTSWAGEADEAYAHYKNNVIIKELEKTYEELLEERNNLTKVALIHKKLSDEVISGNDLQSIARVMFNTAKTPIIIEDINFEAIAYAGLKSDELEQISEDFQQSFPNKKDLLQNETIERQFALHRRVMTPIFLQNKVFGFCSFIYASDKVERPQIDRMILERAATVCSLYLVNEKASFEAEERVKGHFLNQIISCQFKTKEEIIKRGIYFQLDLNLAYYIVVLKQVHSPNELFLTEQIMKETVHYFKNHKVDVLAGQSEGSVILLIQAEGIEQGAQIKEVCTNLFSYLKKTYPQSFIRIGISTESNAIEQAVESFEEAHIALKIGRRDESITLFDELGITGILVHSQNKEVVEQKARHLLQPLYTIDGAKDTEFLQTMYMFLINGGNLEKTMGDLSISMSGLRYRIDKIERLLGKNLRDPETAYELTFIMKALIAAGKLSIE